MLAELADGHAFGHPPAQRRDGFRAHGRLPSEVRLEPHDLRTGRAAAYTTAECLPLLPRERFSPMSFIRRTWGRHKLRGLPLCRGFPIPHYGCARISSAEQDYATQDARPHHLSVAAALQSCGKGCSVWSRLAMRRRPRVNQDVMLRRTRLGCWSGRLRSAGVAWWRASHWPVETAR